MTADGLRVNAETETDWMAGTDRLPCVGEIVKCTGGMAEVVKLHGKTSDGSRLLELKLIAEKAPPFFAAASNVLVALEPAVQTA
jgi:hypothetical protein